MRPISGIAGARSDEGLSGLKERGPELKRGAARAKTGRVRIGFDEIARKESTDEVDCTLRSSGVRCRGLRGRVRGKPAEPKSASMSAMVGGACIAWGDAGRRIDPKNPKLT